MSSLHAHFSRLQSAHRSSEPLRYSERYAHLQALESAIRRYEDRLVEAMSHDFSHRSFDESRLFDIATSIAEVRSNRSALKRRMRPKTLKTPIQFLGAKTRIVPQPLGVVGIIAPWNFPINLSIAPLAAALAAGNRVMLKLSELAPATAKVLQTLLNDVFDEHHVCVITGDAQVAAEFSELPFDHLLFTGSTAVGKRVAKAAANNLTPVTLELGGKSPAIVGATADLKKAATRIAWGKTASAGQICVAPDYVLVPRDQLAPLTDHLLNAFARMYPDNANSPDYTAIISPAHLNRLIALVDEVKQQGSDIKTAWDCNADEAIRQFPPTLVIDPNVESRIMQEEIFGPILPIVPYDTPEQAIEFVTSRDHPLALYLFSDNEAEKQRWINRTLSGGVTINDTVIQVSFDHLPFGGVGASGMGAYHGDTGFNTFSHLKPVVEQAKYNGMFVTLPPFTGWKRRAIHLLRKLM